MKACLWHTDWIGGGNYSTLSYTNLHAKTSGCGCLEGCFKRPTTQVGRYGFDKVPEEKLRTVSLQMRPLSHTVWKALATSRKTTPVNLFSPKFLDTLSMRRVSCSAVLCLALNPNCSFHSSARLPISKRFLSVGSFWTACQSCLVDLQVNKMRAVPDSSPVSGLKTWQHVSKLLRSIGFEKSR